MGQSHSVERAFDVAISKVWSEPGIDQAFSTYKQREGFLGRYAHPACSVLEMLKTNLDLLKSLISNNGAICSKGLKFQLWYLLIPDKKCLICLVEMQYGVVEVKIEPTDGGGADYDEARMKFRQCVEMKARAMLGNIPNAGAAVRDGNIPTVEDVLAALEKVRAVGEWCILPEGVGCKG